MDSPTVDAPIGDAAMRTRAQKRAVDNANNNPAAKKVCETVDLTSPDTSQDEAGGGFTGYQSPYGQPPQPVPACRPRAPLPNAPMYPVGAQQVVPDHDAQGKAASSKAVQGRVNSGQLGSGRLLPKKNFQPIGPARFGPGQLVQIPVGTRQVHPNVNGGNHMALCGTVTQPIPLAQAQGMVHGGPSEHVPAMGQFFITTPESFVNKARVKDLMQDYMNEKLKRQQLLEDVGEAIKNAQWSLRIDGTEIRHTKEKLASLERSRAERVLHIDQLKVIQSDRKNNIDQAKED